MALAFTDENFQSEVLEAKELVVVDFWAEWCGPCRMLGPIIEKLAKDYEGKVKIGKLNVDENEQTAFAYHIQGIPCVKFFKNGQEVDQLVGVQPPQNFIAKIEALKGAANDNSASASKAA